MRLWEILERSECIFMWDVSGSQEPEGRLSSQPPRNLVVFLPSWNPFSHCISLACVYSTEKMRLGHKGPDSFSLGLRSTLSKASAMMWGHSRCPRKRTEALPIPAAMHQPCEWTRLRAGPPGPVRPWDGAVPTDICPQPHDSPWARTFQLCYSRSSAPEKAGARKERFLLF